MSEPTRTAESGRSFANFKLPMTEPTKTEEGGRPFDIYPRVFRFAVRVVCFVRGFERRLDSMEIGRQLLRSGTAVGANMEEADGAESRRDSIHKVGIARKEAREADYWLRLCIAAEIGDSDEARGLQTEATEISRILSAIIRRTAEKS